MVNYCSVCGRPAFPEIPFCAECCVLDQNAFDTFDRFEKTVIKHNNDLKLISLMVHRSILDLGQKFSDIDILSHTCNIDSKEDEIINLENLIVRNINYEDRKYHDDFLLALYMHELEQIKKDNLFINICKFIVYYRLNRLKLLTVFVGQDYNTETYNKVNSISNNTNNIIVNLFNSVKLNKLLLAKLEKIKEGLLNIFIKDKIFNKTIIENMVGIYDESEIINFKIKILEIIKIERERFLLSDQQFYEKYKDSKDSYFANLLKSLLGVNLKFFHNNIMEIFEIKKLSQIKNVIAIYEKKYKAGETQANNSCFIATASFGSPIAYEVVILKKFRDDHLIVNHYGNKLVQIYYFFGNKLVKLIDNNSYLKALVRIVLTPLIFIINKLYYKNIKE